MVRLNEVRRNEVAVEAPKSFDAWLAFIGIIRTPWTSRLDCPRQGRGDGPICRIEVAEPWVAGLDGIEAFERIEVLYWLHESRRDLVRQSPANDGETRGTFSLRSPVRPNPIGTALFSGLGRAEGVDAPGQGSRLLRQNAAHRLETRPLPVHAARAASARRFRDGVKRQCGASPYRLSATGGR
jgi:tRNA (adenine37-N6)-methyltransferase